VLGNLAELRRVNLANSSVADVAALGRCARLQFLSVASTPVSEVAGLATCRTLRHLHCQDSSTEDVRPLLRAIEGIRISCKGTEAHRTKRLDPADEGGDGIE
jgi:Leucine-rich repeat (LRR) protein